MTQEPLSEDQLHRILALRAAREIVENKGAGRSAFVSGDTTADWSEVVETARWILEGDPPASLVIPTQETERHGPAPESWWHGPDADGSRIGIEQPDFLR
jgi:hypothetical protein